MAGHGCIGHCGVLAVYHATVVDHEFRRRALSGSGYGHIRGFSVMSWVTAVWSMLIGACVVMALPHLLVGLWQRRAAHLFFALQAGAVMAMAVSELVLMRATSVAQAGRVLQWMQLPIFVLVVALVGFVYKYLNAGRLWLGCSACAVRFLCLIINFLQPPNLNFREITALRPVHWLGEVVHVPAGIFNPWTRLAELSSILLLVFVLDASFEIWKKGGTEGRRRALVVGGSVSCFILLAAGLTALTHRQIIELPYMVSIPFAGILVAMAFELGLDLFQAGQVAQRLEASQASLHNIEERVALAAEAAHLGVWELNTAMNELWISDKVCDLFQIERDAVIDYQIFQERVYPDDRAPRKAAVKQAIEMRGRYEIEFRVLMPDGSVRWIGERARFVSNGDEKIARLLGVSMDVTKRKEAEELFRLVTEASPSGILLVDEQDRIVLVNAHIEEIFGYERDELIGQTIEILVSKRATAIHPFHPPTFLGDARARAMGAARELFGLRKNGTEFPVEIGLNPIRAPQGLVTLATVVDVSQRKSAEEEAQRRREQLDSLSRVSLLGEMTAALAHELDQPLSAIVSNANAGMNFIDHGEKNPEQLREILADMGADGLRAHDIIGNVRSAIKKGHALRGPINLNDVVRTVTRMLQFDAGHRFCEMEMTLASDLPAMEGDPTQMQQVLINLVKNAFDAMADFPPERRKVEIITEHPDAGTIRVEVRDHGTGFPEEARERLFEQFFTTKKEGLGVGLAIVRSIIQAHGGRITAENLDDGGARFWFTLPVSKRISK